MRNSKAFQASLCLVMATLLALTSHIYISEWVKPILDSMTQDLSELSGGYPHFIIAAAYATAFITVGLVIFLYYHTQHLVSIKSNFLKVLLIACVFLELKGNLIRQPIMDILVNYSSGMSGLKPFKFVALNMMDKWVSSLLLAMCLVYLCPQKYKTALKEF